MTTSGSIYITLKQPFTSFLTLASLSSKQQLSTDKHILYIIDDKLIKDTTGIRIDPTFLANVTVCKLSDVHYIDDGLKNMQMLIIRTKAQPTPADEKGTIRLKGATAAFRLSPGS